MVGKSNAEAMKGEEPLLTKLAPHFTLAETARHAVDFWLTTEDLADRPTTASRSTATATSTCPTRRTTTRRPTGCTTSSRRS